MVARCLCASRSSRELELASAASKARQGKASERASEAALIAFFARPALVRILTLVDARASVGSRWLLSLTSRLDGDCTRTMAEAELDSDVQRSALGTL